MIYKRKNRIREIAKSIDKIINHSDALVIGYNIVSKQCITEREYLEKALRKQSICLASCLLELDKTSEEHQIISDVIDTFEAVIQEKQDIYFYSVIDQNVKRRYRTDRKGHIIGILEWALERITGNIDVGVI